MYELDKLTIKSGFAGEKLMENAGTAVAREILARFMPCPALVLCGPGNNGGDGFVVARKLREAGWDIEVALLGKKSSLKGDAAFMAKKYKGKTIPFSISSIKGKELVVDAIFGAGLSRPVTGEAAKILKAIKCPIVAVDIPSGIDGDNGQILGFAAKAKLTVTFSTKKPGHLLLPGREYCGEVVVAEIGHSKNIMKKIKTNCFENNPSLWLNKFPWPEAKKHKYSRGHAVISGGPKEMTGAARLAATAALKASSGIVTVLCKKDALNIYTKTLPADIITKPISNLKDFSKFISGEKIHAILIGPGHGVNKRSRDMILKTLKTKKPIVLDADAITSFTGKKAELFSAIKKAGSQVVMTPHLGEFKKLFGKMGEFKLEDAMKAAKNSNAVVVLKGADTIIASEDGRTVINSNAPPTLATAGAGDVLAGIITALLSSKMPTFEACCAAVWIHGEAANKLGLGLTAEDLPGKIPDVLKDLYNNSN